jgi:acyl-CoA synthetase (AMP-forming)/AMP-acid ligase II
MHQLVPLKRRVALLLPGGVEAAVALLAVMTAWCAVPLNPNSAYPELLQDLKSTRCSALLLLAGQAHNEQALKVKFLKSAIIFIF